MFDSTNHRRRINTEEKAKVVAASWGDRIYSNPCLASYFALGRFEEYVEFILLFKSSGAIHPILQFVLVQNS